MNDTVNNLSPYLLAAMIGALVTVLGWVVNSSRAQRERRRIRHEKRDDMQKAIYAEIRAYVDLLERYDLDEFQEAVTERIMKENFVPFVAKENNSAVFNALLPEIHVLPVQTIDTITVYYHTVNAVSDLILDMRSERYQNLPKDRRALIYQDYIEIKKFALKTGRQAMREIETFSGSKRV